MTMPFAHRSRLVIAMLLGIGPAALIGCDAPQSSQDAPSTGMRDSAAAPEPAAPAVGPLPTPAPTTGDATEGEPAMKSTLTPATLHRIESNDGSLLVIYRTRPEPIPVGDRFTIEVSVHDRARGDALIRNAELVADAAMPHHRHGMNVVPTVRKQNDGSFVVSGMLFHMPGRWEIYFDVTRGLVTERAQAEVWVE